MTPGSFAQAPVQLNGYTPVARAGELAQRHSDLTATVNDKRTVAYKRLAEIGNGWRTMSSRGPL
jgi:hypothetical protein